MIHRTFIYIVPATVHHMHVITFHIQCSLSTVGFRVGCAVSQQSRGKPEQIDNRVRVPFS